MLATFRLLALLFAGLLLPHSVVLAEETGHANALNGVKEAKAVFLVDLDNPRKTALYLGVIQGTHERLVRQHVKPDMVIVFIGPTVRFLTTRPEPDLEMEHGESLKSIADSVRALHQMGVRLEVCALSTQGFHVVNDTVLPEVKIVEDGFVSLIGWQTQGYKLVPIF
jgi:intracellular sulfur oxidation DsrE/DsrF family protein